MYPCLQGEGKFIGIPHLLIRVSGCKLRCQFAESFCDTPFASWAPEKDKFTLDDFFTYSKKSDVLMERNISKWDDKYFYNLAVNNAKRLSISTPVLS